MSYTTIQLEIAERTATLTLNRPQAMNAMDQVMLVELAECFESLHKEETVQVLIIKGAGKVYSAGGDVKLMAFQDGLGDFNDLMSIVSRLATAYYTLPMITVSQVYGAAAGIGFSLALGSDIIVAEKSAKLAMNFINIGLIPDGGGHFFMKERLGTIKAKQAIWEGKLMLADEALQKGLIDYSVEDGTSSSTVDQIVGKLLASPLAAMIETKLILHKTKLPELQQVLDGEAAGQTKMRATNDHQEGVAAFVQKRVQEFAGN